MVGYFLILAIIILGGVIAMVGDRIGSRVGKARLSLFNLRPKNTAVLVTILTGSVTAASTMAILLATNQQLRDAVFRIGEIQRQSRSVKAELDQALAQQDKIQVQLAQAREQLAERARRLQQINRSLTRAIDRQQRSEQQLKQLQNRFQRIKLNLKRSTTQAQTLKAEIKRLATEERQLQTERQRLLTQRDQVQGRLKQVQSQLTQAQLQKQASEAAAAQAQVQLEQVELQKQQLATAVTAARQQLQTANTQQAELMAQQMQLQQEVAALETSRQGLTRTIEDLEQDVEVLLLGLRRGNITIRTGQILAAATVQNLTNQAEALQAVDALLLQARQSALKLIQPSSEVTDEQVIQISQQDVDQLVQQMSDGQAYVIRILAAANYLLGEESVLVIPQLAENRLVFEPGKPVAAISINPAGKSDDLLLTALNQLFQQANRRALSAGILANPLTGTVGEFEQVELFRFILALQERKIEGEIEIFAIAATPISVAGPLKLQLIAIQDQQVILRSG